MNDYQDNKTDKAQDDVPQPTGHNEDWSRRIRRHAPMLCLAVLLAMLLLVLVVDSVMSVAERLASVHPVLAALLYVLISALAVAGVLLPAFDMARRPVFGLYRLNEVEGRAKARRCQVLIASLENNGMLSAEEAQSARHGILADDQNETVKAVVSLYAQRVEPQIDKETLQAARTAFFSTALSQSPLVDAVTTLTINFNLVRSAVSCCGFRPNTFQMLKLYVRIMTCALVAGSLEEVDLESVLAGVAGGGAVGKVSGVALAGIAQGMVNAFFAFRVGHMVKMQLCSLERPQDQGMLRRESYRAGFALMKDSGFLAEITETVKGKASAVAGSVAESVVENVKGAANAAGKAAQKGVAATAAAVSDAVADNPVFRAFRRAPQREDLQKPPNGL